MKRREKYRIRKIGVFDGSTARCYRAVASRNRPRSNPIDVRTWSGHDEFFKTRNIRSDRYREWLVDWESSFPEHRYEDLAVVASLIVDTDAAEGAYLQHISGNLIENRRAST